MINGRIHCTFNQIARETEGGDQKGARYGRLSCVDPNLQQQPARDEFAAMWRSIYIPEEGAVWGCLDYSQQEPRWTTHFSALMGLPKAEEAARRYREDPTTDNHTMMAELTGLPRKQAKGIYLGLCYGEGGAKLCDDLGLPTRWAVSVSIGRGKREVHYAETQHEAMAKRTELSMQDGAETFMWRAAGEEGQQILNTFDNRAPFIKKLAKEAEKRAKQKGYITTLSGRRLHFPEGMGGGYDWTHKALNRLIQGTSADQTKSALVAADAEGYYLQLQVHDEFDGSFGSVAEAKACAKIMSEIIPNTQVPFKVDVEMGPSWGQIEEVA
jgi:DNA polymerase I-like protein with 3'-5' exonuclease and polymerase domains